MGYRASTTRQKKKRTLAVLCELPEATNIPLHNSRDGACLWQGEATPFAYFEPTWELPARTGVHRIGRIP
jgi:hypothetical protein